MIRTARNAAIVPHLALEEFRRRILHEDSDLLVIDKPAGWSVHGDRHNSKEKTLLALALAYLKESDLPPQIDFQAAFVHRLDKETSGLMVLAKTHMALRSLNRQLKFKRVQKKYVALLAGEIHLTGSIHLSLQRVMDRKRWLALMVPVKRGGVYAKTDYRRLELFEYAGERLSLVEAHPRTGRTHQLRAHFAAIECPIIGDDLYGRVELNESLNRQLGVRRQLLHAIVLEFAHPITGTPVHFEAPWPDDFRAVVERLRQDRITPACRSHKKE